MINRSLIRVKAFQELYSRVCVNNFETEPAKRELIVACNKSVELFALIAALPASLALAASDRVISERRKFTQDTALIERLERFASNSYSKMISSSAALTEQIKSIGISWRNDLDVPLKSIFNSIIKSSYFADYLAIPSPTLADEIKLFKNIYSHEVGGNALLEAALEECSIWWADDLAFVVNYLLNKLSSFAKKGDVEIPPLFKEPADKEFALKLVGNLLVNYDEYAEMVSDNLNNWELSRLVLADVLIASMGIAEAVTFEDIPLKVTINEYVDLAKYYSTPRSYIFVNGVLNKLLKELAKEGKIKKNPLGMVGSQNFFE